MYSNTRRGRGGIGAAAPPGLSPTIGPDVSSVSVADRVSKLNLTTSTLTPHTESRIRLLLDEILLRGQYAENAFELVAYACALEKEKDARLLGLILDLIFEKVKESEEIISFLGRLFLIFAHEILPSLEDGVTVGSDGSLLKGHSLFGRFLLDRCRRELDLAWDEKEKVKEAGGDIDAAVRHWRALVDLVNDLRKRSLVHESVMHDIIEKQMSAPQLTPGEVSTIIILLSPAESNFLSFHAKDRMEVHYSRLSDIVANEKIEQNLRKSLQEYVLGQLPNAANTTSSLRTAHAPSQGAGKAHPLAANVLSPALEPTKSYSVSSDAKSSTPLTSSPVPKEAPISQFDPSMLQGDKFQVDAKTPLTVIVAFFTQVAQPPVADFTSELQSATFSENPISSSVMSDVWRATLQKGVDVAVKCVKSTMSGNDKAIKHTVKELAAWSQQQHANILQLLGIALYQGKLAMVSEWMEQGSIVSVVNKEPKVDRYNLCLQIVGVVAWLHNKGLIHGDLKGANILISDSGVPKITDFGLTVMREGALQFSETFEGGGTMRWMAPELFEEHARKSFKTDVYALGMTMLEVLTGREPFPEISSPHGIIKAVSMDRQIPKRPDCLAAKTAQNEVFWDAMVKCWVYDPASRATAEEVEKLIGSLENGGGLMKSVSAKRGGLCSSCTLA